MVREKLLKATHGSEATPLKIGETEIPCYVLENGQRVLSRNGLLKALGMSRGGGTGGEQRIVQFVGSKTLSPFIDAESRVRIETPIKFQTPKGGGAAYGYDAETLQVIVRAVSKAFLTGKLQKQQEAIGKNAEKLDDAFSKVGLIALIDEATGYQYERESNELHKILKAYISEELLPWQQRFPHEFYREIFRLKGWPYTAKNIKSRPGVVGTWTNKLVYNQLPKGILTELKRLSPADDKKAKKHYHRFLTEDVGHPHLQKQLISVITLMNISESWAEFLALFNKKFGQQELDI